MHAYICSPSLKFTIDFGHQNSLQVDLAGILKHALFTYSHVKDNACLLILMPAAQVH